MSVPNEVLITAFSTAFLALAFTIRVLWCKLAAGYKYLLCKSEDCERDRESLWAKIENLQAKVSRPCHKTDCPFLPLEKKS